MKISPSQLLLPLIVGVSLSSCLVADYPAGPQYSASRSVYGSYAALPQNYTGDAYYHGGRYYSGGRYESGNFHEHGKSYSNRYYHDGRYYYGVRHEHHDGRQSGRYQHDQNDSRREHSRTSPYQQLPNFPRTGWRS